MPLYCDSTFEHLKGSFHIDPHDSPSIEYIENKCDLYDITAVSGSYLVFFSGAKVWYHSQATVLSPVAVFVILGSSTETGFPEMWSLNIKKLSGHSPGQLTVGSAAQSVGLD